MNVCKNCKKETRNKNFCSMECQFSFNYEYRICPICNKKFKVIKSKKQKTCNNSKCINILRKQSIKNTFNKKYGVDSPSQLQSTKDKIKEHRRNGSYDSMNENIKKTLKIKYGNENAFRYGSDEFKYCIKEKYGNENYNNREKFLKTMTFKYGAPYVPKIKNILGDRNFIIAKNKIYNILLDLNLELLDKYNGKRKLNDNNELYQIKYKLKCKTCQCKFVSSLYIKPHCPKCNPKNISIPQQEILIFLTNIYNKFITENTRSIIPPLELDLYIKDKNLAIELNGNYWHSELNGKDKTYHLNKTEMCNKQNIKLLHVFENEWMYKKNIIKSIIKTNLNINNEKIYARKCTVREININIKDEFLKENHLQGKDKSKIKLGLYYNDILVSVMTFSKSRFNKKYEYEIYRFANKLNTIIVGGASKLFKYFIRNYNPNSIITYSDRRYFNGNIYEKLNFNFIENTTPSYYYFNNKNPLLLENRMKFQKHKLDKILTEYNENLTEWENMQLNGYDRIWDCGHKKYVWETDIK